jgi:O-antigen/teichoic acid export membrane protein
MLAVIGGLGFTTAVLQIVPGLSATDEHAEARGAVIRSKQLSLLGGFGIAVVAAPIIWGLSQNISLITVLLGAAGIPVLAFRKVQSSLIRAFERIIPALLPQAILHPLVVLPGAAFLWWQQGGLGSEEAMLLVLVAAVAIALTQEAILTRTVPDAVASVAPSYRTSDWLRVSLPMLMISGSLIILNRTDVIMVGAMVGSAEAGIYAMSSRIAALIVFGLTAVNTVIAPVISRLYAEDKLQELQVSLMMAAKGILLMVAPVSIGIVVWGQSLLELVGPDFTAGYVPLVVLCVGQSVNALAGSVGILLNMTGHERTSARVYAGAAVLNIVLNLLLVPAFGMTGAAIATALTTITWNVILIRYVRRTLGLRVTIFGV